MLLFKADRSTTMLPQGKAPAIADFDWKKFSRVVDVGGAYGSMLAAVLEDNPAAQGVLFELPQASLPSSIATRAPAVLLMLSTVCVPVQTPGANVSQVAERAKAVWAEKRSELLKRTTIVGGSFFDKGPCFWLLCTQNSRICEHISANSGTCETQHIDK